jgi:hypothetical protein
MAWQWQDSPQGLIPTQGWSSPAGHRGQDNDD